MRTLLLTLLVLLTAVGGARAQSIYGCGTEVDPADLALPELRVPTPQGPGTALGLPVAVDTLYLPVMFHRVARDNGTGAVTAATVQTALRTANRYFAPAAIRLVEVAPGERIDSDALFDYNDDVDSALVRTYNTANVLNVYVMSAVSESDPSICGFASLPWGSTARRDQVWIKSTCFGLKSTFAHEVGHYLGLIHTHGPFNCRELTKELVDGSNCATAGDLVCDTPADPGLTGFNCETLLVDENCTYTGTAEDANGERYAPDVTNLMSYTREGCERGFSPGQVERMRYYFINARGYLIDPTSTTGCSDLPAPSLKQEYVGYTFAEFSYTKPKGYTAYEVEYTVTGGAAKTVPVTDAALATISGIHSCNAVSARIRGRCPDGNAGPWSAATAFTTKGCALDHCLQINGYSYVYMSDLKVGGTDIPEVDDREGYSVYGRAVTVDAGNGATRIPLSITAADLNGGGDGGATAYVGVWIDANRDGLYADSERRVTTKVARRATSAVDVVVPANVPRGVPLPVRVTLGYDAISGPCAYGSGETVDLLVRLERPPVRTVAWRPSALTLSPDAATGTVTLTVAGDWRLSPTPDWFTPSAKRGNTDGDFKLGYAVTANRSCAPRSVTVRVTSGGQTADLTITQAADSFGVRLLSDAVIELPSEGGDVRVAFQGFVNFAVTSSSWIPDLSSANFSGTYSRTVRVGANTDTRERRGFVAATSCGKRVQVAVVQAGRGVVAVKWDASTLAFEAPAAAQRVTFSVDGQWSIVGAPAWLLLARTEGDTTGQVRVRASVTRNTACAARTATLTLRSAEQVALLTVMQEAASPVVTLITDTNIVLPAAGGTVTAAFVSPHTYDITGAGWLSAMTTPNRLDTTTVSTLVPANPSGAERTATVTAAGCGANATLTVTQAGAVEEETVDWSSETLRFGPNAFQSTISFASSGAWTVSGAPAWFTLGASAGAGAATSIDFSLARHTGCTERTATLVLTSGTKTDRLVIVQEPAAPEITVLSADTVLIGPLGGPLGATFLSEHAYSFTASAWLGAVDTSLQLDESTVSVEVPREATDSVRTGVLTASGCGASATVTIVQEAPLTFWNDSSEVNLTPGVDTFSVSVASNVGWAVDIDREWLTIVDGASTGDGRVVLRYEGGATPGEIARVQLFPTLGDVTGSSLLIVNAPLITSSGAEVVGERLELIGANPFGARLELRVEGVRDLDWEVYGPTGQRVYRLEGRSALSVGTEGWPDGLYFVRVRDAEGRATSLTLLKG